MIIRNKTLNAVVSVCLAVALFLAAAPTAFADPPPDDAVEKLIALYTRIGVATNYGALGLRSLTDALDLGEANLDVRYVKALASWAAIAAMATGQNPRLSAVYFPGTVNSQPCDLISVLLERMGVDGSYGSAATGVDEQSGAERGSAQINALLALEMYYGGADWGVPGGNERQTRVSAIETFLGDIQDAKKTDGANPAAMNWSVENGRFYFAETVPSFTLLANVATDMQPLAVALLCRWLEDETPVRVNGAEPAPLKEVAAREIPGLLKTCLAMYAVSGTETGHKIETGATSQAQTALRTRVSRAEYQAKLVTALIAAGEKDLVDELGLIETLETYRADRFDRDSLLDTDPQTPIIIADLDKYDGGYISLNAYDRNATAWVAMAYGDYLYDRSILSTFVMDRDLDNASSVEFDLNILVLPEYAEGKLYLPVLGDMGSAVTWTSSNSAVIDPVTGIVTPGGAVVTVWLTAEAVKGDALAAREFFVVVPAQVSGAQAALAADLRNLIIPLFTTADIDLPVAGEQGSAIVWASSDTDVIKDEGKVTLAADERKITLTATLTSGDAQAEKVFPVRVGRIVAEDDLATKAVYLMREYYQTQETRNFRSNPAVDRFGFGYWSVWLAKAALGDDFADYGFNLPDPRLHKLSRIWQGTDYGAVILQLLAQGDNPYDHFGVDYVEAMHDYIGTDSGAYHWGPFASEVFLAMALDATGEMTPELYRSVQGGLLGWTGYMGLGPDIGSWAMVPLAGHYSDEYANQAQIEAAFGSFRKLLLAGLVMDVKDDNYGLTVVKDIGGYIHATSNACVLIGAVAAQGIGFPGFDLLNGDEWITNKGKPNETTIIKQLYKYAFEGKDGPYSTQVAIAFADLYNGENIWASVGITPDDFAALLDETETVLTAGGEEYTAATVAALRLAYAEAAEFAEASYGYGRAYFALRDAYRGLKPAGATAVTILGAEETLFDTAYVVSEGSALEILAQYASEYRISQTATATGALEIDGIWPAEGAQWRVYSGETRLTDLGIPLGEGAELTFKYAADAALIPADATLGEHLARETASTLSLESEVTEDLVLLNSGNFGTTITWNSNKPLTIDPETGKVTPGTRDIAVTLTATVSAPKGFMLEKIFDVTVRSAADAKADSIGFRLVGAALHPDYDGYGEWTEYQNWINPVRYPAEAGASVPVAEVFAWALENAGLSYVEGQRGYITQIEIPARFGGGMLAEFTNGPHAGWMYTINGEHSGESLRDHMVEAGDEIVWHYADDFLLETDMEGGTKEYPDGWLIPPDDATDVNVRIDVEVTSDDITTDENGFTVAAVTVDADAAEIAVNKAVDEAREAAETKGGVAVTTVEIPVTLPKGAETPDAVYIALPAAVVSVLNDGAIDNVSVTSPVGDISLNRAAIRALGTAENTDAHIVIARADAELPQTVPDSGAALYELSVYRLLNDTYNVEIKWSSATELTISLPYELNDGETADGVTVWYVDGGNAEEVLSRYSVGKVTFTTNHLSHYAVGYVEPKQEEPPEQPAPEDPVISKRPIPNGGSGPVSNIAPPVTPADPAAPITVSRASLSYISGADRVLTSVAISRQGWESAETVILAPGGQNNLIDALAVAPLAGQEDAPILLSTGGLDPAVVAEIQRLGAKKVYAVGALSQAAIEALRAALPGLTVETLRGASRFETAALIGAKLSEPQGTFVVGYNAVADAVSAASYAAAHGYLIQIAGPDGTVGLAAGTPATGAPVYILGGPALVRDIPGATRLYGATRYETNKAIRDALPFEYTNIYTADGGTLVDALTGSALAARSGAAIVLTPGNDPAGADFGGVTAETKVYAFGAAK